MVKCCTPLEKNAPQTLGKLQKIPTLQTSYPECDWATWPPFPFKTEPATKIPLPVLWTRDPDLLLDIRPLICERKRFGKWYYFSQFLPPVTQVSTWEVPEPAFLILSCLLPTPPPWTPTPAHSVDWFLTNYHLHGLCFIPHSSGPCRSSQRSLSEAFLPLGFLLTESVFAMSQDNPFNCSWNKALLLEE